MLDRCEKLIRLLDPSMDQPCYLVDFADVASYEPRLRGGDSLAWTSRVADLLLADWLTSNRRWQGRGFASIVHIDKCESTQHLIGACLHEYGHFLDTPIQRADASEPAQDTAAASRELLGFLPLDWASPAPEAAYRELPPWHQHGSRFIRASSHLAFRVGSLVESVRPRHLSFGSRYYGRMFNELTWMSSLDDELTATPMTRSIRELLDSPEPELFRATFADATSTLV